MNINQIIIIITMAVTHLRRSSEFHCQSRFQVFRFRFSVFWRGSFYCADKWRCPIGSYDSKWHWTEAWHYFVSGFPSLKSNWNINTNIIATIALNINTMRLSSGFPQCWNYTVHWTNFSGLIDYRLNGWLEEW